MNKIKNDYQKGFTLMETLGVIAIIAIILAIGIPFVSGIVKDSSTQDFVSNAKNLEDAAHMYYRDEGKLPTTEIITDVTDRSKLVIKSELLKAGILDPETVIEQMLIDGVIKKISYDDIREYTRVTDGDEGTEEFMIIDSADISNGKYGVYENEIAGFVFSTDVRENSSGVIFSGSYKVDDEQGVKDREDEQQDPSKLVKGNQMTPYGFRLLSVSDNKDGTANVKVTWTNRVVDDSNKELRGYLITDFGFKCDVCSDVLENTDGTFGATLKVDIAQKKLNLTLVGEKVKYGSLDVEGMPTKEAKLVVDIVKEITNPGKQDTVPVPGSCPDGSDGCLDEVTGGDVFEDRNDLYDQLEEANFDASKVSAIEGGLLIKGVEVGNYIVMKEIRRTGNIYNFDPNRTRLFIAKEVDVLIPKNPYLQDDFQKNPYSSYEYILEEYKNMPCASCSTKTAPDNGVVVYYGS